MKRKAKGPDLKKARTCVRAGKTVGCKGCLAKMRGAVHAIHSDACRARMQKEMQATDEGRRRVRKASERVEVHRREIHEERAAKRVKHGEITERASSSGKAPSYIRVGPSDVETKETGHRGASQGEALMMFANISRMVSSVRRGWSITQMTMATC